MKHLTRSHRYLIVVILMVGQSLCLGFGPPTLTARDLDETPLWPSQVQQIGQVVLPKVEAPVALLVDVATGTTLYERNAQRRVAPASTTKIMTALVALERGDLWEQVVVQPGDLRVESSIGLSPGEVWSLEDMLYALLLPSDNAAALVIARHLAGSEAEFVRLMNERAASWGLEDTHFANPHGLDEPEHYSTASDLAQMALRALEQPLLARIVGTKERQAGARWLVNLNQLLGAYEGAQGVKTGTTDQAGQCLVSAVERPDGRALCVVLGSADRYQDSRALLDYYFAAYCTVPLGLGPKGLNRVLGPDGREEVLVLREHPRLLLPRWQLPFLRVQRVGLQAEAVEPDGPAGTARFVLGATVFAELPLYATAP